MSKYGYPSSNGFKARAEVPEGHYSRLCDRASGEWDHFDEQQLANLADTMKRTNRDVTVRRKSLRERVPSGYVYLGQFIDHDITRDNRTLDDPPPAGTIAAGPDVEQTLNYRTPRLDLDLLYGRDPWRVPCIYEGALEPLRLRLGPVRMHRNLNFPYDLFRRSDGTPVVIDPRSDENLIVAQLHVLFAKFHNCVLQLLHQYPCLSPCDGTLFARARRFVTWHYQAIVLNEFLPRVAREDIVNEVGKGTFTLFPRPYTAEDCPMAIPAEFAAAAFRFGHSMVRNDGYVINYEPGLGTQSVMDILRMTHAGRGFNRFLPPEYIIRWELFFGSEIFGNKADFIDTYLATDLHELPVESVRTFRSRAESAQPCNICVRELCDKKSLSLPCLTLVRGSRMRLPSGQEFVKWYNRSKAANFKITKVPAEHMCPDVAAEGVFDKGGFRERTPLWYYLLREAAYDDEYDPEPIATYPYQKLGRAGSLIVAEVLNQVLNADPSSIRNAGISWRPPAFVFGESKVADTVDSMWNLIKFVNSPPSTWACCAGTAKR